MSDEEKKLLITTYFRQFKDKRPEDFWAWEDVEELMHGGEEIAFSLIIDLLGEASDKDQIAWVATGPFETLLHQHSPTVIKRIQQEVRRNKRLRYALMCIYVPQSMAAEIEAIKTHYQLSSRESFAL